MPSINEKANLTNKVVIFAVILTTAFGILVGLSIRDFPILIRNDKVSIVDLFKLFLSLLTLLVGIYIAHIVDGAKKIKEYKIDYTFKKLDEIKKLGSELESKISGGHCELSSINNTLKRISMKYIDLKDSLKLCGFEISSDENKKILEEIQHIKRLSTESRRYEKGTNIILQGDNDELTFGTSNDNVTILLSIDRVDEIKTELDALSNMLFKYSVLKN